MMIEGAGAGDSSFLRRSLTASFRFSSLELGAPGEPAFLSAM
jgi:hypothetical protein